NVVSSRIPPLRERKEDIPYLITHFLRRFSKEMGTEFSGVDEGVMTAFGNHPWPGNVREMENVLKRAAVLSRGAIIAPDHLPEGLRGVLPGSGSGGESLFTSLDLEIRRIFSRLTERESAEPSSLFLSTLREVERSLISAALEKCGWNQVRASRLLGLHRGTLRKKMADYDLVPPGNGGPSYRGDA
ncbi:MAG: sigma-54-dependent Fis family transcriptional regulator, partial [Nitrospirae bacterium]|nr:sigma-54-dependent Fis family transcriptional regulator [Nitrospirota bacterium]